MLSLINKQFIEAAQNNQLDELKNLLIQGADIHADDDNALRWAASLGHLETVKFLIAHGANIHANNDKALKYSAYNGHLKTVKFLVTHGADIHANNDAALGLSADKGHLEIVKFLVEQGANIHTDDDEALRLSAKYGHLETVKFLITQGADIHANDDEIFKKATKNKNEPMLMLLNAFLTEEKLLVAASESMLVLPSASTWVCGTAVASVALVAAVGVVPPVAAPDSTGASSCLRGTEVAFVEQAPKLKLKKSLRSKV